MLPIAIAGLAFFSLAYLKCCLMPVAGHGVCKHQFVQFSSSSCLWDQTYNHNGFGYNLPNLHDPLNQLLSVSSSDASMILAVPKNNIPSVIRTSWGINTTCHSVGPGRRLSFSVRWWFHRLISMGVTLQSERSLTSVFPLQPR